MTDIISYNVDKARRQIEETKQAIEWVGKHGLLDLPNGVILDAYITEGLAIKIAPGKNNFKRMRQAIGKGWERRHQFTNDEGDVFINYFRRNEQTRLCGFCPHLLVVIDAAHADGARCRVETVAKKTIEVKRVVCS